MPKASFRVATVRVAWTEFFSKSFFVTTHSLDLEYRSSVKKEPKMDDRPRNAEAGLTPNPSFLNLQILVRA